MPTAIVAATRAVRETLGGSFFASTPGSILTSVAARHAAWILRFNGVCADAAYIEDLIEDVLADTLLGTRTWDPNRCPLWWHVLGAIDSRIGHELDRAEARPHFAMEVLSETLAVDVEDALAAANPASNAEDALLATQVITKLRELAAGDREVLALLDAICAGLTERADVMQATGMSLRQYDAARHRLDRLVGELPHSAVPRNRVPIDCDARQVA